MRHINVSGATNDAILAAIGEAYKAHVLKQYKSITAFSKKTGLSRNTLNKFFQGDVAQTDTLLRILRALGHIQILEVLTQGPEDSPMEKLLRDKPNKASKNKSRAHAGPDLSLLKTSTRLGTRGGSHE